MCLGDGRTVKALRKGNIRFVMSFKTSEPKRITMYNALCVPQLASNLFSVRAMSAKGNSLTFSDTQCWIHDGNGKLLGTESLIEKLYIT